MIQKECNKLSERSAGENEKESSYKHRFKHKIGSYKHRFQKASLASEPTLNKIILCLT